MKRAPFFLSAVAGLALMFASTSKALVLNISATLSGPGFLGAQNFIPSAAPNAHFGLDTLAVFETIQDGGIPSQPGVAWVDLLITVTRDQTDTGTSMIAIDKFVRNFTSHGWWDFHMTLGTGSGLGFVESNEFDFLSFKEDPSPLNEAGILAPGVPVFGNPPMFDDPVAPDNLWWVLDSTGPGPLLPGQDTSFWAGINVPGTFFNPSGVANFTVRQHATTPEPGTLTLLAVGAVCALIGRARRRRSSKQ